LIVHDLESFVVATIFIVRAVVRLPIPLFVLL